MCSPEVFNCPRISLAHSWARSIWPASSRSRSPVPCVLLVRTKKVCGRATGLPPKWVSWRSSLGAARKSRSGQGRTVVSKAATGLPARMPGGKAAKADRTRLRHGEGVRRTAHHDKIDSLEIRGGKLIDADHAGFACLSHRLSHCLGDPPRVPELGEVDDQRLHSSVPLTRGLIRSYTQARPPQYGDSPRSRCIRIYLLRVVSG